jgi:uncharacterized membrane-anchored protein
MAESEFSWLKIVSFFGAAILIVVCFVMLGFGISAICADDAFHGIISVFAALVCGAGAVIVYKYYQKKSIESRYGK